tara:strand:- start:7 stop:1263 length:1257 start_codon:yes stop_codon:yes gene_type:complete
MKNIWILLLLPLLANADTSQNLITNGTFDNGTTGWTLSGDAQRIGDCCPGGHDLEFGDYGSIEQTFPLASEAITQPMLNNGITLNSSVEVQNGEGGVGSWAPNRGGADTFTIRLQIRDEDQNVLATTTQERTNVTGINGKDFTDTVSYTGVGSNYGNIFISGSDANAPANLGGPNVDNISVTMEYDPVVLTVEQTQEIQEIFEQIEEVYIEEIAIEEVFVEPIIEEVYIEPIPEVVELTIEEEFIEETIVLAPEVIEEEIISVEPEVQIEETVEVIEEVFEEIVEAPVEETNETEVVEETETNTEVDESNETAVAEGTEAPNDNRGAETQLTIEEISIKVADKIKTIDGQLKATQMIVAKVMARDNKISSYSQVNTDIFIQPELVDTNIDQYINNNYVDIRNIYPNQTYEDRLWTSRQ